MHLLYHPIFLEHETGLHPENKQRLTAFTDLPPAALDDGYAYLDLIHTPRHIQRIQTACATGALLDPDTLTSTQSFEVASRAVAAAILASETNGFALTRPPGHHAYADRGSGFCLFNNVAVATQKLVREGKRVLILDFDGHYGDGTSDIFYDTDQVLFWSLHQYPAYPGNGFVEEIGEGKGKGYTMNVPLPPGSADDIFLKGIEYFMPAALQFKPDVVALSAGFDAHSYEPLLDLNVSYSGFYRLGKLLGEQFEDIFAVLEGGYNVDALQKSIIAFLAGINGQANPYDVPLSASGMRVHETFEIYLYASMAKLSPYWRF
ncbi:MAG: histone deacetylase [Bacteroidota bacterium]